MNKCKQELVTGAGWGHIHLVCQNKAVTRLGYCRTHDPKLREARAARRKPCKWQLKQEARDRLVNWLRNKLSPADVERACRLIALAWAEWETPPWPMEHLFKDAEEPKP